MHRYLSFFLVYLVVVTARDMGKTLRTMPFVTNSLVNLGKMDISFYLNARPQDLTARSDNANFASNSFFIPKSEKSNIQPCPCSSLRDMRDSAQSHPSDLISKILSGNDLFSFKEPDSSTLCCDSHENVQEDILLEFSPKQTQIVSNSQSPFSILPFILEGIESKPSLPKMPAKKKSVDIFVFSKNREMPAGLSKFMVNTKDVSKNDNIKLVGDKKIKNEFKSNQFVPPLPSSVKKDSARNISKDITEKERKASTINNKSNTV